MAVVAGATRGGGGSATRGSGGWEIFAVECGGFGELRGGGRCFGVRDLHGGGSNETPAATA